MSLEIAKIQNDALKKLAQSIDQQGNKNNFVDDSEMSLFINKASTLLNEGTCTSEDFQAIFNTTPPKKKETTVKLFERLDSINASKNTPEELEKFANITKQEDIKKRIKETQINIENNNKLLKTYEERLAARSIPYDTYDQELHDERSVFRAVLSVASPATLGIGGGLGVMGIAAIIDGSVSVLTGLGVATGGLAIVALGIGPLAAYFIKKNNNSSAEQQADMRNQYKEAYLEVQKSNERLYAELEALKSELEP